jgi:hypothetical protein
VTELVAEFSGWNNLDLRRAFTQACNYVSQTESVSVVDAMYATPEARQHLALAVFAADLDAILVEPCTTALRDLTQRQLDDIRMALGIAATGAATPADALVLAAALGPQPAGASREVVAAPDLDDLYAHIVRWLTSVIATRPTSSWSRGTLAQQAAEAITDNLATSNVSPAQELKLRQRP